LPENETDCKKIEQAFLKATKVFDESAVRVLMYHLEDKYHVHIGSAPCSSVEQIYAALLDIAGSAADLLISRMRSFLR
jgi:hypothetical protein